MYDKQTWADGDPSTPLSADRLNHLEDGVSAANAALAVAPYGPNWVFDGDSITIGSQSSLGGAGQDRASSWTTELAARSMGAINYVHNAALSGQRSDGALDRFDTQVAPRTPDTVLLTIGTNDVGQSRTLESFLSNMTAYHQKCEAIGARLIVGAIWPTALDDPTGRSATVRSFNDGLYAWAAERHIDVVPWDLLADPTTGGWPASWTTDLIHPTESDAYAQIGLFGYQYLAPKLGVRRFRRAVAQGDGLLPNGFMTSVGAVLAAPTISAGTPGAGGGTLPIGTYSYRMTNRTLWGESAPSAERQVVLASVGTAALTFNNVANNRQKRIYRKAPAESTWRLVAQVGAVVTTWTDDGSAVPTDTMTGVDTSAIPVGLINGNATSMLHKLPAAGPYLFTEDGVRGNVLRLTSYETGTTDFADYFNVSGLTEGTVLEFSCLARSSGPAYAQIVLRFRNAVPASVGNLIVARGVLSGSFRLFTARAIVPAGATQVRVGIEGDDTSNYVDVAELRLVQVA